MVLTILTLRQFRNYEKKTFEFSPDVTLIFGANTAGKTNILEAIYALATGKSFRADKDMEMIRWGHEVSSVKCQVSSEEDKHLELMITSGEIQGRKIPVKKYMVNGVSKRQIDFVGHARVVLFWPEHLELVTDSPSLRRKYLDSVLVQADREYRRNLISYERGLRQRNRLLLINEGKAHRHQLQFWDQLLIRAGGCITDKRAEYIEFINNFQFSISNFQLTYDKSVISESRLEQYKDEEVAAKATLVGPHRDDFLITKNDLDLGKYGSRGEQRLAILWLKLAELTFIETRTGERPLLILDDIFSELDVEHRALILDLMGKQQTIVSSAEEEVVDLFHKHEIKAVTIRL